MHKIVNGAIKIRITLCKTHHHFLNVSIKKLTIKKNKIKILLFIFFQSQVLLIFFSKYHFHVGYNFQNHFPV